MQAKQYKVTCLRCKRSNLVLISKVSNNEYFINLDDDHRRTGSPAIISGRYRRDMNFGWECVCGNDSRLARQEFVDIEKLLVKGGDSAIQKITESLETDDDKKFRMEPV